MRDKTVSSKYMHAFLIYCSVITLLFITAVYIHHIINASHNLFSTDFNMLYESVRFYYAGQNIYSPVIQPLTITQATIMHSHSLTLFSDLNPPFLILLLLPFAYLSYGNALLIWSLISFISTVISILLVIKSYPALWQNTAIRCWSLAGCLIYLPIYANFCIGQISSILLFITVAAWYACRNKNDIAAGILLGLALSIKIFFGLFLIYFIIRKQGRALIIMLSTFTCTSLVALLFFGKTTYLNYLNILQHVNWYASSWNASLYGFIFRIFEAIPLDKNLLIKWANLPHLLYLIVSLLFFLYFIKSINYSNRTNRNLIERENKDKLDWQFSLTIVLLLFISPLAWLYYFTLLIIPYITIIKLMNKSGNFNYYLCLLIITLMLSGIPISYNSSSKMLNIFLAITSSSYYFYALLLIFILLKMLRKQIGFVDKFKLDAISKEHKFSFNIQTLLYFTALYPSIITFTLGTLNLLR